MSRTAPPYPPAHALLAGKSVLVTAAAGTGIGFATAKRCAEEGATVILSDQHERRLGEAAEQLAPILGKRPTTVPCDVTVEAQVQHMFEVAVAESGQLDVLVNNAGLGGTANLVDMTDEQWLRVLDVTLNATFRCTRAAFRHMLPRRAGVIVNNASVLGWRAQAGQAHYAAAKAGVMALTRCAAIEAADAGVRVNAVAPSLALHPFLQKSAPKELLDELETREAFGRAAEPWEVANVIVFLASDYSTYMTGEIVSVSAAPLRRPPMIPAPSRQLLRHNWTRLATAAVMLTLIADVANAASADAVRAASERAARAVGAPIAVSIKRGTGQASFVRRVDRGDLNPRRTGRSSVDTAQDFVVRHGDLFGLHDAAAELDAPASDTDGLGRTRVSWRQRHGGVEVFGAVLRAHLAADGTLQSVNGAVSPIVGPLAVTPGIAAEAAERSALAGFRDEPTTVVGRRLVIYDPGLLRDVASDPRLAYAVETEVTASGHRDLALIDALDGRVLDRIALTPDALARQVSQNALANVVWSEGDPDPIPPAWSGGSAAQVAAWQDEIDGARESYAFHGSLTLGSHLSYDGADAPMLTRHDPPSLACPNASWNGETTNYCPGVTSDDVVSHEWGHAYTQFTANLVYAWQSGALNESYSDVWGETVDLLNGRQTDAPGTPRAADGSACSTIGSFDPDFPATDASVRWLVSEDSTSFGGAIRDMWHPECRADPGRVGATQYHCTTGDGGGVHTNSGVPNHLYALLVDGGVYNSETVAPLGITKAASILWRAISVYETPVSDFSDHADALEASCADLVGAPLGEPVTTAPPTWTTAAATISAADCTAVAAAIAAVELRAAPPCVTIPILQPNPPELCDGAGAFEPVSISDFESGLAPWTAGTRAVTNPLTYDGGTWTQATSLPDGHAGAAAFTADPIVGDCELDDETGVSFLESPAFVAPSNRAVLRVAFTHWIATEPGFDGGNVKVSVNGGAFEVVPPERFTFNAYNLDLNISNNTCPLAGEPAWSGSDGGGLSGSWGESQLDLVDLVEPGDTVRLRFELGMDACNGNTGWYVDDVRVYTCSGDVPLCPATPLGGCKQAPLGRSQLTIKDNVSDGKDRLQWSWKGGAATNFPELGNPVSTTRHSLCIWDGRSGTPTLVSHTDVEPGSAWSTNGTTRTNYKDSHATQDGVSKIALRVGVDGKAQASLQAKGALIPIPAAASLSVRFEANPNVTVQLVSSTGACWQSTFTTPDFRTNSLPKTQASHKGP